MRHPVPSLRTIVVGYIVAVVVVATGIVVPLSVLAWLAVAP